MDNLEALKPVFGEAKAKKILKLTEEYDKYVDKFKKKLNALLEESGFEVKTGIAFTVKEEKDGTN